MAMGILLINFLRCNKLKITKLCLQLLMSNEHLNSLWEFVSRRCKSEYVRK